MLPGTIDNVLVGRLCKICRLGPDIMHRPRWLKLSEWIAQSGNLVMAWRVLLIRDATAKHLERHRIKVTEQGRKETMTTL